MERHGGKEAKGLEPRLLSAMRKIFNFTLWAATICQRVIKQQSGVRGNVKSDSDCFMQKNRKAGDQGKAVGFPHTENFSKTMQCVLLYIFTDSFYIN